MDSNYAGRYALANPGEGITGLCINGDVNLFGGKSIINTTFRECFPDILDEPKAIEKPKTDLQWWSNLLLGVGVTLLLGALAVCTGGLLAVALAGAAVAACAVTVAASVSDYGKGGRDTWTFLGQLLTASAAGFVAGASIAMAWTALPAAASAVGLQSAMWFGTSTFTAIVVPQIATYAGYVIIGTSGAIAINQAIETGSGRNFICEYIFGGDADSYELFTNVVDAMLGGMTDLGNDNSGLVSSGSSDDDTSTPTKPSTNMADGDDDGPGGTGTMPHNQAGDDDGPGGTGTVPHNQAGDDDGPGGAGTVPHNQAGDDDGPGGTGTVPHNQAGDDDGPDGTGTVPHNQAGDDDGPEGTTKPSQSETSSSQEAGEDTQSAGGLPDEANSPESRVRNSTATEDSVDDNSPQSSSGGKTPTENEGVYLNVDYGDQYTRDGRKKVLKPNVTYETEDGYVYTTNANGDIASVEGYLQPGDGKRNPYAQRTVGGDDRLPTDDGGHLIASQFNGSGQIDNLVPMDSQINRAGGKWYKMEQEWAEALEQGKDVYVQITPNYNGNSHRPDSFYVEYTIEGQDTTINLILNQPGG